MTAATGSVPVPPDSSPAGGSSPAETAGAVRTGVIDIAPLALAVLPFAVAIGAAAARRPSAGVVGLTGAVLILAGTAQLVAIEMVDSGAGVLATVATALALNARFVLYGAGLRRWFPDASRRRRALLAVPIVDQIFVLCERRFDAGTDPCWRERYYRTVAAVLAGCFVVGQVLGWALGAVIPEGASLQLAAPLVFVGLLAGTLRDRPAVTAAVTAAVAIVVIGPALGGLGLIGAIAVGVGVAATLRRSVS